MRDAEAEIKRLEIEVQRLRQRLDELATERCRRESTCAQASDRKRTSLSTGEAIGAGAALMMVILTEGERDANLLRGRKSAGALRFLFLDEANRLSHDNLGVLFTLC